MPTVPDCGSPGGARQPTGTGCSSHDWLYHVLYVFLPLLLILPMFAPNSATRLQTPACNPGVDGCMPLQEVCTAATYVSPLSPG